MLTDTCDLPGGGREMQMGEASCPNPRGGAPAFQDPFISLAQPVAALFSQHCGLCGPGDLCGGEVTAYRGRNRNRNNDFRRKAGVYR